MPEFRHLRPLRVTSILAAALASSPDVRAGRDPVLDRALRELGAAVN